MDHCGVAKLVRRLIVNQEMRRFESGPHSQFSGSRLDGKPPALGAGESEFDSRDPDSRMGTRCCWRHAGPANPMDGFESHSLHLSIVDWESRIGNSPAGPSRFEIRAVWGPRSSTEERHPR